MTKEQEYCKYCHSEDKTGLAEQDLIADIYVNDDVVSVQVSDGNMLRLSDQLNILEQYQQINFCPICGRKLVKEN